MASRTYRADIGKRLQLQGILDSGPRWIQGWRWEQSSKVRHGADLGGEETIAMQTVSSNHGDGWMGLLLATVQVDHVQPEVAR